MKDDYCSLEISKLLKDKGFNEICAGYYDRQGRFAMTLSKVNNIRWEGHYIAGNISAPTLQMAMKWLRERYKLNIIISVDDLDWFYSIIDYTHKGDIKLLKDLAGFNSYENAMDAAILECLTNLI